MAHEWIEVLNRRWCVCCSAFQQRKSAAEPWRETKYQCANNSTETTTITTFVSDELSPEVVEIVKDNARRELEYMASRWWRADLGKLPV